ncbi:MAG: hypothetical protein PHW46_03990, partial [Candidatus Omnitrophica bacterium]|nr:hypothetical protein [Candidatus Omnitrophota bacterium]
GTTLANIGGDFSAAQSILDNALVTAGISGLAAVVVLIWSWNKFKKHEKKLIGKIRLFFELAIGTVSSWFGAVATIVQVFFVTNLPVFLLSIIAVLAVFFGGRYIAKTHNVFDNMGPAAIVEPFKQITQKTAPSESESLTPTATAASDSELTFTQEELHKMVEGLYPPEYEPIVSYKAIFNEDGTLVAILGYDKFKNLVLDKDVISGEYRLNIYEKEDGGDFVLNCSTFFDAKDRMLQQDSSNGEIRVFDPNTDNEISGIGMVGSRDPEGKRVVYFKEAVTKYTQINSPNGENISCPDTRTYKDGTFEKHFYFPEANMKIIRTYNKKGELISQEESTIFPGEGDSNASKEEGNSDLSTKQNVDPVDERGSDDLNRAGDPEERKIDMEEATIPAMGKFEPVPGAEVRVDETGKLVGKLKHVETGKELDLAEMEQEVLRGTRDAGRETKDEVRGREKIETMLCRVRSLIKENTSKGSSEEKLLKHIITIFKRNLPDHLILSDGGTNGFFGIGKDTFLVVDKKLAEENPIAFLHEMIEYIKYTDDRPTIMERMHSLLNNNSRAWLRAHKAKYRAQGKLDYYNANINHYVIRAFTRQVFGEIDEQLSGSMKQAGKYRIPIVSKRTEIAKKQGITFVGKYEEAKDENGECLNPVKISPKTGQLEGVIYNIDTKGTLDLSEIKQHPAESAEIESNVDEVEELINSLSESSEEQQFLREVLYRFNIERPKNIIITDAGSKNFFAAVSKDFIAIDQKLLKTSPIAFLSVMMLYVMYASKKDFDLIEKIRDRLRYSTQDEEQFDKFSGEEGLVAHEIRAYKHGEEFYRYFSKNKDFYVIRAFTRQVFKEKDYNLTLEVKGETIYNTIEKLIPDVVHRVRKAPTYVIEPVLSLEDLSPVISYFRQTDRKLKEDGQNIRAGVYLSDDSPKNSMKSLKEEIDRILPEFYKDVTSFEGRSCEENLTRMVIRLTSKSGDSCGRERGEVKKYIAKKLKTINPRLTRTEIKDIIRRKIRFVDTYVGDKTKQLNDVTNLFTDITMAECYRYKKRIDGTPFPDGYTDVIPDKLVLRFLHLLRLSITNFNELSSESYKTFGSSDVMAILKMIFAGYVLNAVPINWNQRRIEREKVLMSL